MHKTSLLFNVLLEQKVSYEKYMDAGISTQLALLCLNLSKNAMSYFPNLVKIFTEYFPSQFRSLEKKKKKKRRIKMKNDQ